MDDKRDHPAVTAHVSCLKCDYDLFSLPVSSNCPECGHPIINSIPLPPATPSGIEVLSADGVLDIHVGGNRTSVVLHVGAMLALTVLALVYSFARDDKVASAFLLLVVVLVLGYAVASARRQESARLTIDRTGLRIRRQFRKMHENHYWPHGSIIGAARMRQTDGAGRPVVVLRIRLRESGHTLELLAHYDVRQIDWLVEALRPFLHVPEEVDE